jgi:proline iminopeptidase
MKIKFLIYISFFLLITSCETDSTEKVIATTVVKTTVTDTTTRMIPIATIAGEFNVYTKQHGSSNKIKVLILHGGPGCSHKYLSNFEPYFSDTNFEYYYYDQLGSGYSDHPNDTSLWNIDRFVDEIEQVRKQLGMQRDNFYLYGQSWGGILAIEYALKYQQNLKGLIISNMMASCPKYTKYVNEVLGPQLPTNTFNEIKAFEANNDFENPRYMEILMEHYYAKHVLRKPLDDWPAIVNEDFDNINAEIYVSIQGPSEFGIIGDAKLKNWDRSESLKTIDTPTLCIGAKYDTMDPEYMQWMASQFPNGTSHYCPNGSHLAMWDDADVYYKGLIDFIKSVDSQ